MKLDFYGSATLATLTQQKTLSNTDGRIQRVMFLCNHATYFHSHRLEIAKSLILCGSEVILFCGSKISDEAAVHTKIKNENIKLYATKQLAGSANPFSFLIFFLKFLYITRILKPNILHCVSMKAVIIGLIFRKFCSRINVVIAISGLGSIFTEEASQSKLIKIRSVVIRSIFALLIKRQKNVHFIVQNDDDKDFLISQFEVHLDAMTVIPGSGIQIPNVAPNIKLEKKKQVVMASRLLTNKGVIEFLTAVKYLSARYPDWNFLLAGENDLDSPAAFKHEDLVLLINSSGCTHLGYVNPIEELLKETAIFVLPSYREGFPKAIIEAAVAGCAIVTTNVTGCRDAVLHGELGVLIEPRNPEAIDIAVSKLIEHESYRLDLARKVQDYAIANYSIDNIISTHFEIYESF